MTSKKYYILAWVFLLLVCLLSLVGTHTGLSFKIAMPAVILCFVLTHFFQLMSSEQAGSPGKKAVLLNLFLSVLIVTITVIALYLLPDL